MAVRLQLSAVTGLSEAGPGSMTPATTTGAFHAPCGTTIGGIPQNEVREISGPPNNEISEDGNGD